MMYLVASVEILQEGIILVTLSVKGTADAIVDDCPIKQLILLLLHDLDISKTDYDYLVSTPRLVIAGDRTPQPSDY